MRPSASSRPAGGAPWGPTAQSPQAPRMSRVRPTCSLPATPPSRLRGSEGSVPGGLLGALGSADGLGCLARLVLEHLDQGGQRLRRWRV